MNDSFVQFFGLRENPFHNNADPRYLCMTRAMASSLAKLAHGISNGRGLLVVTGDVGTGKTTLIRELFHWLSQNEIPTAVILNSNLDNATLLDVILAQFGAPPDFKLKRDKSDSFPQKRPGSGPAVVIVDEAQGLSCPMPDNLASLSNLEAHGKRLFQVVLAGQRKLEDNLRKSEFQNTQKCVSVQCRMEPLSVAETRDYVQRRLTVAGASDRPIFEANAVEAVYFYSLGIPRAINSICHEALVRSSAAQIRPVSVQVIEDVTSEFQFEQFRPRTIATYSSFSASAQWMAGRSRIPTEAPSSRDAADPAPLNTSRSCASAVSAAPSDAPTDSRQSYQTQPPKACSKGVEVADASPEGRAGRARSNGRFELLAAIRGDMVTDLELTALASVFVPNSGPEIERKPEWGEFLHAAPPIEPSNGAHPESGGAPWAARTLTGFLSRMRAASLAWRRISHELMVRWLWRSPGQSAPRNAVLQDDP
jgi:type II secretory pathway predicted ATPase ExeA